MKKKNILQIYFMEISGRPYNPNHKPTTYLENELNEISKKIIIIIKQEYNYKSNIHNEMKNIINRIKILIYHTDFYENQKIIVLLNMLKNKIDEIYKYIEKRFNNLIAIIFTKNEDELNKISIEQETLNEHLQEFSKIKNLIDNNIENIFTKLIEKKK